jgi:hypothetical protein
MIACDFFTVETLWLGREGCQNPDSAFDRCGSVVTVAANRGGSPPLCLFVRSLARWVTSYWFTRAREYQ